MLLKGCIKLNDLEILAYDEDVFEFEARKFHADKIEPVLGGQGVKRIQLSFIKCNGVIFGELLDMIESHRVD